MIRLDKYLANAKTGTRSQVRTYIKKGQVTVNGKKETKPDLKIEEQKDLVFLCGSKVTYTKNEYYMFYKPAGCISATEDKIHQTVLDFIPDAIRSDLYPVGRLDIDAEGLLIITNDGPLCHNLLSPKKHVSKTYYARILGEVTAEDIECFAQGVDIGEKRITRPAVLKILSAGHESEITLSITEGKFHQVKRMFEAVDKKVLYLKRIAMGQIELDEALAPGEYRPMTEKEIELLKNNG